MSEENGEIPVNKDPALLRQMLKKVTGKNHKLKEEISTLLETIKSQESALLAKEETIMKAGEKASALEAQIKGKEAEIQKKIEEFENLKNQKNDEINDLKEQNNKLIERSSEVMTKSEFEAKLKALEEEKLKFE